MKIERFKIEDWMNRYCPESKYDLTSACIQPLSLKELLEICRIKLDSEIFDEKLTYGEIHGSSRLKSAICSLYINQKPENITVTHGGIGANELTYKALIQKGDEVIVFVPTYQQHCSIPKSLGAEVKTLMLDESRSWLPNLKELEKVLSRKTRLICINNPNNPTGAVIPDEMLFEIADMARKYNTYILSDEVCRGLNISGNPYSMAIADIYENGISVGSMSKTYSLPGLRLGWVAANEDLIGEINKHREYNTISVSIPDDYFSSIALENRKMIEARNQKIMENGLRILKDWLDSDIMVRAEIPRAGAVALVRYIKNIPSKTLCRNFQAKTGVALLPAETMDMENFVRIGFCIQPDILKYGLEKFSEFLRTID